jgi:peptide/nickel transport system substrate-binding protein
LALAGSCRRISNDSITIALPEKFSGLDTISSSASDAAADRVRNLIFNGLVKKNEKFEYVGELADKIDVAEDGTTVTFTLRDGVKFHNGAAFTSADVKYTFDTLFEKKGYKSGAFFDTEPDPTPEEPKRTKRVAHIVSIETPDPMTVVFKVTRPALVNQLLSNLVAIPIIAQGTADTQVETPVGTGPFKFVSLDKSQNILELAAFPEYWDGPATIGKIRVKTITDASALQSELQTGAVDIAPVPSNLPPDSLKLLEKAPNLTVQQFEGSNIQYLGLNTSSDVLNNKKIRQAIGYAIDRQKIIDELLFGQAKIAHSILPPQSWAYSPGTEYTFDQDKARELIKESGYKNEPIVFKYSAGNTAVNQYAQVIQSSLVDVGLNVRIETVEPNVLREQLAQGGFQINTGTWIGGNQDPIFLRDLFSSTKIPGPNVSCCNRSRYKNAKVDEIIAAAENARDREVAKQKYIEAWALISDDMPLFPLWYPANMVVANKRIGNIKINPSGDWSFVKDLTLQ